MADAKSMSDLYLELTDAALELTTFADVSVDLAGDDRNAPVWPWLVMRHAARITEAADALHPFVHRAAPTADQGQQPSAPLD